MLTYHYFLSRLANITTCTVVIGASKTPPNHIPHPTIAAMSQDPARQDDSPAPDWLALVREKVETLRYGVVTVTVHERKVTQIERTERTRLDPATPASRMRE